MKSSPELGIYYYEFSDPEVECAGYFRLYPNEDPVEKAKKLTHCWVESDIEVTFFMTISDFEELVITGAVQTHYSDMDD